MGGFTTAPESRSVERDATVLRRSVIPPQPDPTPAAARSPAAGGDLSRIPVTATAPLPTRLAIGSSSDASERDADRIAAEVTSGPGAVAGAPDGVAAVAPRIQAKGGSATGITAPVAPPLVHRVLQGAGRPLDASARSYMEPRFQRGFAGVRVHDGAEAAASAASINARAYTVGNHVVFGAGQYAPATAAGRRLIAHELAHVVQQGGAPAGAGVIRRAEVDDRSCAGLTDIETDIDTMVNTAIKDARAAASKPLDVSDLLDDVKDRLGAGAVSPIEKAIESMPATKRSLPPSSLAGTKYAGVDSVNRFYKLHTAGAAHVVGSAAKVHGVCIGADKLGHFFQEGLAYYRKANEPGKTAADADEMGRAYEILDQGLKTTGVYSNADQAANRAGMKFYTDLAGAPTTLTFRIASYIASDWNEQSNPSYYRAAEAGVVWRNLLAGNWAGPFTFAASGPIGPPILSSVALKAAASGSGGTAVTGTYEWPASSPAPSHKGTITNGAVTNRVTHVAGKYRSFSVSDDPVSGVTVDFDWSEPGASGKGQWMSVNEKTLHGTWGDGAANSGGGTWNLDKV